MVLWFRGKDFGAIIPQFGQIFPYGFMGDICKCCVEIGFRGGVYLSEGHAVEGYGLDFEEWVFGCYLC